MIICTTERIQKMDGWIKAIMASSAGVILYFIIVATIFPHDIFSFIVALMIGRVLIIVPITLGAIKVGVELLSKYESLDDDERENVHHRGKKILGATLGHLKTKEKYKAKTESFERFMKNLYKEKD